MLGLFRGLYGAYRLYEAADAAGAAAESIAPRGGYKVGEAMRELRLLNERLDKLVLINMAICELLQEKVGLSDKELADKAQEIDLRDGVPDGKVTRTVRRCSKCGRTISRRHNKCLFCGSESLDDTILEAI